MNLVVKKHNCCKYLCENITEEPNPSNCEYLFKYPKGAEAFYMHSCSKEKDKQKENTKASQQPVLLDFVLCHCKRNDTVSIQNRQIVKKVCSPKNQG